MSEMKVELVDSMGNDLTVANVARVSFNKWKDKIAVGDVNLIRYLAAHEHTSPFRHTAISVRCKAPIFLARQLGKHQVGMSWNEVSRRYVDTGIEFYVPKEWRSRPEGGLKQGSGGVHEENELLVEAYEHTIACTSFTYNKMVEEGVAPEMARMVLPQSMMTEWVWTGSLTSFFHLWRLRIDGHAQVEAQEFAKLIEEVVKPIFPHSWKALTESV